MQSKISDRFVTYQLIDLFSDLILAFLEKVFKVNKITFCVDDAQWLDQASIRVFEALVKKSRKKENYPIISLFLNIHDQSELSNQERQNYTNIYRILSNLYPNLKTIYLENFDLPTTTEVIKDTNRFYLLEQIPLLYKITNGNPLELEQTLRFSDKKIREIIQRETINNHSCFQEDIFTTEHVIEVYYQKTIYAVILNTLSVLQYHITVKTLFQCIEKLYKKLLRDICLYSDFLEALDYLEKKDYITYTSFHKEVIVTHSSTCRIVADYLSQNGDFIVYGKIIADVLLTNSTNDFHNSKTYSLLALKLLCDVDPQECINSFKKICEETSGQLKSEFFIIASNALCSDYWCQSKDNIELTVCTILPKLISSANLTVAQRLCHTIYLNTEVCLSIEKQISFLINYIKAQIDLSVVDNDPESAVMLFEKLYKFNIYDWDLKLQVLLLGMSTYEHLLAHEKILQLYSEAESIVDTYSESISDATLSVFHRNKGLCFSHSELRDDYFQAVFFTSRISDVPRRQLLFGTSMNNLGLSYFYSSRIKLAKYAFISAKKHLDCVGYNTARISNNIGVCFYMIHDFQAAYYYFSTAATEQTEGIFMRLCIQTNLALVLYTIGKQDEAKNILDSLINEYEQGKPQSKDTLVYCAAMINRGYIAFKERHYFQAADYYQKSLLHTYRYQNKEQRWKREEMRDISIKYGVNGSQCETNLDLTDTLCDFYKKPYSLIPFAFYVI